MNSLPLVTSFHYKSQITITHLFYFVEGEDGVPASTDDILGDLPRYILPLLVSFNNNVDTLVKSDRRVWW